MTPARRIDKLREAVLRLADELEEEDDASDAVDGLRTAADVLSDALATIDGDEDIDDAAEDEPTE